ncbi:MAG: L-serine ammonia-lyase [Planctomycetota bacterium]
MAISVFDLFSVGIGPSSSHTVGPMLASNRFLDHLREQDAMGSVSRIEVTLFGSLGATGKGHGSDRAVVAGLSGLEPETVTPEEVEAAFGLASNEKQIVLGGMHRIAFDLRECIEFARKALRYHSNALRIVGFDSQGNSVLEKTYFSVGGGFVVDQEATEASGETRVVEDPTEVEFPFATAKELLSQCDRSGLSISTLVLRNESAWRGEDATRAGLNRIWQVMQECVAKGCESEGILPGGLKVRRRAAPMYRKLAGEGSGGQMDVSLDWVNLWALAVNEENAAGGRVVTAPTNGAAGIIPAVLHYYDKYCPGASSDGVMRFLLTAGAIGMLFKINASISGAEVGCQGEVGSACSMAAGGLAEVLGGTPQQVENAAEIGMEHNLGLTCDPIGGLVQVPCIERNAMAAVKAINAARLALRGDGKHFVSLDKVIATMRETGRDMKTKYKETARGGLAVNVIEC